MPLYTYLCTKCSEKFDMLTGVNQEKMELKCPRCGTNAIEKQFAPFRILGGYSESSSSKCSSCSGGNCSSCH